MTDFHTGRSVLTVLSDPSRAAMYGHLAGLAGVDVVQADGALHALTQLERTHVDAIICDAVMPDMSAAEFRDILKDDVQNGGLPIYLIGDEEQDGSVHGSAGPEVLAEALEALGVDDAFYPVPLRVNARPQLSGQLEPFSLTEFLTWAAELECSGHWLIAVGSARGGSRSGHLTMNMGRLAYAEFAGRVGREAVLELLRCTDGNAGGSQFRFYQAQSLPPSEQPDLSAPTVRLLMELAVDLDEASLRLS